MFPSAILTSSGSKSAKTPPLLEEEMSSHFDRLTCRPRDGPKSLIIFQALRTSRVLPKRLPSSMDNYSSLDQALHPLSLRSTLAKLNRIEKGQAGHLVGHLLEMKLCNSQRKGDYDWNSKSAPI